MANLHVNLVLLSTSKDRVDAIRAASRRKGFACTVVADENHATAVIRETQADGILVVDAEATRDLPRFLHDRLPNWPILVLSAQFDSSAWIELFKAGASEVIGDPLHARKVDAALEGFLPTKAPGSPVKTLWHTLARRLGMR